MKYLLFIFGLFLFVSNNSAQVSVNNYSFKNTEFSSKGNPTLISNPLSYSNVRSAKRLNEGYQGYVVEMMTTSRPLKKNHNLFSLFGNVFYKKVKNKGYVYYILLDFKKRKSAQNYLEQMILPKVPKAKLVKL